MMCVPFLNLQFPEFIASFFSRLSLPSVGSTSSAVPTRNVLGNVPSYAAGRQVEASINLNYFSFSLPNGSTEVYYEFIMKRRKIPSMKLIGKNVNVHFMS